MTFIIMAWLRVETIIGLCLKKLMCSSLICVWLLHVSVVLVTPEAMCRRCA